MQNEFQPISEEELAKHLPKRRVGCLLQVLIGATCLGALLMLAFFAWSTVSSRDLNESIARLRNAGVPTTRDELLENYKSSSGPNPGPLLMQAYAALREFKRPPKELTFVGSEAIEPALPGESWNQLGIAKAYLAERDDVLAMIERAAKTKIPARYDRWFANQKPDNKRTSFSASHRDLCRLMGVAAFVHAHQGNTDAAANALTNGLRISKSLSDEPSGLSQTISAHCTMQTTSYIRKLVSLKFTDAQLLNIQETLRELTPRKSVSKGLAGETYSMVLYLKSTGQRTIVPNNSASLFVDQALPIFAAVREGSWLEIRSTIKTSIDTAKNTEQRRPKNDRFSSYLAAVDNLATTQAVMAAELLVVDTLIAAKRFQLIHGKLPIAMEELVPEFLPTVPVDPFSNEGESLILTNRNSVLKIYSRGTDTVDDGGDAKVRSDYRFVDITAELRQADLH